MLTQPCLESAPRGSLGAADPGVSVWAAGGCSDGSGCAAQLMQTWDWHWPCLKMWWRTEIAACGAHCLNPALQFFVLPEEDTWVHLAGELVNGVILFITSYHHQNCSSVKNPLKLHLFKFSCQTMWKTFNTISTAWIRVLWIFQIKASSPPNINFIDG